MTAREFQRFLDRDGGCVHCGAVDIAVPNHRINRGMGGSKDLERPANVVVLCSIVNGWIESDPEWAAVAKKFGWKLESWQVPEDEPVLILGDWYLLGNDHSKTKLVQ